VPGSKTDSATSNLSRLRDFGRENRTLLTGFALAVVIFIAGLANVLLAGREDRAAFDEPTPEAPRAGIVRVGPQEGETLAAYLERKSSLLARRAASEPSGDGAGALFLNTYLPPGQIRSLIGPGVEVSSVMVRIPLPEFSAETLEVGGGGVAGAVGVWRRRLLPPIREEVSDLEAILPTVEDPGFREVYQSDLEIQRRAAQILQSNNPAVVFAVIVETTYARLHELLGVSTVRFVDLPPDGTSAEAVTFTAILPES
jgi:hypothetical protein